MRQSRKRKTSGELRMAICYTASGELVPAFQVGNLKPKGIKKNIIALGKAK